MPHRTPALSTNNGGAPIQSAEAQSGILGDVTGITGSGRVADGARLISQFGLLNVFAACLLVLCGFLVWYVVVVLRADALNEFQKLREEHKRQIEVQREDHKEDRREMRDSIKALWANSRALTEAQEKANENTAKTNEIATRAIETASKQLILMEKLVNKMP